MAKKELSEKRIDELSRQPIIKSSVSKSKDGKWILHKTTIVDIKPMSYLDKVLCGEQ
ncbi:MAG TPA: hypothetical protein HA362_07920 [Nanoarchaeota archaeon]|nr:hypothetical protein [Nanoarchaeota archaeon]